MRLIILFLLFTATQAVANVSMEPEKLRAQAEIEEVLSQRIQNALSTRLEKGSFQVYVSVELIEAEQEQARPSFLGAYLPRPAEPGESLKNYTITNVQVDVALDPKHDEEYLTSLQEWLQTRLERPFPQQAEVSVSYFATLKVDPPGEVAEKAAPSFAERFSHFQNAIGLLLLGLFLLTGILLLKWLPSRDTKEHIHAQLKIQELRNAELKLGAKPLTQNPQTSLAPTQKSHPLEGQINANLLFDNYQSHQKKAAFLALSDSEQLERVLSLWLEEGEEGRKKTAAMVDSLLSQVAINQGNELQSRLQNWQMPESLSRDRDLAAVYRKFAAFSLAEKTRYVEACYWDLLSFKTLGSENMGQPFAHLATLPAEKIHKLLSSQAPKAQSLSLLHLPPEKLQSVMSTMPMEEKKKALETSLSLTAVAQDELTTLDESLKFLVRQESQKEAHNVEVDSLVPNFLLSLKPLEEIQMLQDILPRLPDQGESLRRKFPALCFLGKWPNTTLKTLLSSLGGQELRALAQALPEDRDQFLGLMPARMRQIVQDDLAKSPLSNDELNTQLQRVKTTVLQAVNEGQIDLNSLFADQTSGVRDVA